MPRQEQETANWYHTDARNSKLVEQPNICPGVVLWQIELVR